VACALQAPPDTSSASVLPVSVQSLPALPSPAWLVVAGFLPFTWIRDRKRWVAMLTGLVWLGQVGLAGLPRLTVHVARPAHVVQPTSGLGFSLDAWVLGARGLDRDYASSLYRLASSPAVRSGEKDGRRLEGMDRPRKPRSGDIPQAALATSPNVGGVVRIVSAVRQFDIFSAGFCFPSLARGPPVHPLKWGTFPVCVGGPQRVWPFRACGKGLKSKTSDKRQLMEAQLLIDSRGDSNMRRIVVIAMVALVTSLSVAGVTTLDVIGRGWGGTAGGGEFIVEWSANPGVQFGTFCIENNEYISLPTPGGTPTSYYAVLNTEAIAGGSGNTTPGPGGGDLLDARTA
jgi:hypothetical protein